MVKHKSKYSCGSAIYFNLDSNTIKENCKFNFYYNKTDITPTILDDGNEVILANWPNDKHIICNINNEIPIKIPRHPYVLVNISVVCNCGIEAENHFPLESLAVCQDEDLRLVMHFTVIKAFINYLDHFSNLTESLKFPITKNKTTFKQTLPTSLNVSKFDSNLLTASSNLKYFIHQYTFKKEIFDLQERHDDTTKTITNKNIFSDNYIIDILLFLAAVISLLATTFTIYFICKHKKLKTSVASLILQQVNEVGTGTLKEINTECKILTYVSLALMILGLVMVAILHYRKSKLCRGCMFSNAVKIMVFISDVQCHVPIKLCKTAGSIHLFKIMGMLKPENIKLN